MKKTGSPAKQLFSNLVILLLILSCTKESIKTEKPSTPVPSHIELEYTLEVTIPQFSPQKIISDITGTIFVIGNSRRLVFRRSGGEFEEIDLESIYPCEIIDIDTDGFDIFLLDRLNKKIWTIKREALLERGFSLDERPLNLGISERNYIAVIFSDQIKVSVYLKNEKLFTGIQLDQAIPEGAKTDLLFRENILYIANGPEGRIDIIHLFNPSTKLHLEVNSPTSLAIDRLGTLFSASQEGILYMGDGAMKKLHEIHQERVDMWISDFRLLVLDVDKGTIDVYSIVYTPPDSDTQ